MSDIGDRIFNLGVVLTVMLSGFAYGWVLLWAINIRDAVRLWAASVMPGLVFISVVWGVRAVQDTTSAVYGYLLLDFVIFGHAAFFAVLARRRLARRAHLRDKEG